MTNWIPNPHDKRWMLWEEQLAPDRWLVCFRPAEGHTSDYWINVLKAQWTAASTGCPPVVEDHVLDDVLMQACIMHEMRKKYGANDGAL